MSPKTVVIIGAGPAGLTAAYELIQKTDFRPIIFEATANIGGIAQTINYKGNRIDIGGHRFFSKSDRIMNWWLKILPVNEDPSGATPDKVMLIRNRLSRIFFLRNFFDYPIRLNLNTIKKLGIIRLIKIGLSYVKNRLLPIKQEKSLEDFFINRFGRELYLTFFKDYTEKVWGIACDKIKPEWGAQRIKGLSISKAIIHAIKSIFSSQASLAQKNLETSLIERFLYPKFGPGQMWEEVAKIIEERGGVIYKNQLVKEVKVIDNKFVTGVSVQDKISGQVSSFDCDYVISSMPVKDLISGMNNVPVEVSRVSEGLIYRDFITVGLLLNKLKIKDNKDETTSSGLIPDNWIYVQERDVKVGRLQIFNNWSPFLVEDKNTVWIGLEYFCNEGDELWSMADKELINFAKEELAKIDIIELQEVLDGVVIRMPKAYPAYFGSYEYFDVIKKFTNQVENLFLVGRNGMHRYNNQDHSMLTAMLAVENIINNRKNKENIWNVNTEDEYHEQK